MNYAPRNNVTKFQSSRARSGVSVPVKIIGIIVVILVVVYTFLPRVFPSIFLSLVHPLWKVEMDTRLGTASIEELRTVYKEISSEGAKNNSILVENNELKNQLARTMISDPLLATILKKPPFTAYDSLILDVGEEYGVEKGDRIYALGNIPVGEIVDVVGNVSRAKLYSSFGEKFDILIGPSHIQAVAIGKGGGYFEVSLPRDTKIKIGEEVLIPTLGDSFVGTVDGIASDPSEPFAKILFHQPFNIYEQRWVIVDTHGTQ